MTKKEMITIIKEFEKQHYQTLKNFEKAFGKEDIDTEYQKARWAAIYELSKKLKIEQ